MSVTVDRHHCCVFIWMFLFNNCCGDTLCKIPTGVSTACEAALAAVLLHEEGTSPALGICASALRAHLSAQRACITYCKLHIACTKKHMSSMS